MQELEVLIKRYEEHVEYCQEHVMKNHESLVITIWVEERMAFQKVLIDLYKIREGLVPDTDLTPNWNSGEWEYWCEKKES
jgi:hypothetical protein